MCVTPVVDILLVSWCDSLALLWEEKICEEDLLISPAMPFLSGPCAPLPTDHQGFAASAHFWLRSMRMSLLHRPRYHLPGPAVRWIHTGFHEGWSSSWLQGSDCLWSWEILGQVSARISNIKQFSPSNRIHFFLNLSSTWKIPSFHEHPFDFMSSKWMSRLYYAWRAFTAPRPKLPYHEEPQITITFPVLRERGRWVNDMGRKTSVHKHFKKYINNPHKSII